MGTKADTLDAALMIAARDFSRKPFDQIKVADIAKEARCSITTIYDAYGNKEGLILAGMSMGIARTPRGSEVILDASTAAERIFATIEAHARYMLSSRARMTFWNTVVSPDGMKQVRSELKAKMHSLMSGLEVMLREAMDDGDFLEQPTERAAESLLAVSAWRTMTWALVYGLDVELEVSMQDFMHTIFDPHLAKSGLKKLNMFIQERGQSMSLPHVGSSEPNRDAFDNPLQ
jgi:AcrR family transcriptional regulator